jgi:glutamate synthase (NADPH) small chain
MATTDEKTQDTEEKTKKRKASKAPRTSMQEQKPEERRKNFNEVPFGYTPEEAIAEADRCLLCKNPVCIEGCPVEVDIKGFIALVQEGKFTEAAKKIKETNALPAICGRVCPQEEQCEIVCVKGKKDDPVAIGNLERFVADYEAAQGEVEMPTLAPPNGRRVAVVGSGPAGLTVAGDLVLLGYEVVVHEAFHEAGGVLVYGIPEFRLPKAILKREMEYLENLGVKFEFGSVVGRTTTVDELLAEEGYDAVFIGVGAGLPIFMGIAGENLMGVYSANEYLTRVNLMRAWDFPKADTPIRKGSRVAVIGGGNTAMDSARTALRLGAEKVYLVYRRSRAELPARAAEIHHAEEEGIDFQFLTNPIRFLGDDERNLTGMECLRMELGEPDSSGRRRPVPIKDSNFVMDVDVAIIAIGTRSNPLLTKATKGLGLNKWGYIEAEPATGRTTKPGVFAGGDIIRGAATVILAMGDGRKAARGIHQYLDWKFWGVPEKNPRPAEASAKK